MNQILIFIEIYKKPLLQKISSKLDYFKIFIKKLSIQINQYRQNQRFLNQRQEYILVRQVIKKRTMERNNQVFPQLWVPNQFQQNKQQETNSIDKYMTKIAKQIGGSCLTIYDDIKKYKQKYNDLSDYKFPLLRYEKIKTESNVCARILTKDVKAFKCHDCIYQSNSIMCVDCFQNSDHKGHIYELIKVYGGCCDCGDEQKWNPKGSCRKHNDPNLVQQIKKQVNAKQQKQFVQEVSFCFIYFFLMYNDAQDYLKVIGDENDQEYKKRLNFLDKYGMALIDYLQKFNTNSLISNIMTYRTLSSHIQLIESENFQLNFCPKTSQYPIFEIILKCTKLRKSCDSIVNLFTQLFTIRQFKRQLTITYAKLYFEDENFAMCGFNHLSCQLLTSHKLIKQLVQNKQIRPFVYKPCEDIKDFQVLANNYVRYYIDIQYLSKLYKQSSEIYLTYHINEGYLPTLASYRIASLIYDETINYYGIQQIYLTKLSKIMKVIYNSKKSIQTLQKGMQDLFKQCQTIYSLHYDQFFNQPMTDDLAAKYVYLSHQLSLSMVLFAYIQKLDQQGGQTSTLTLEQKIQKIMKILNLTKNSDNKNKILGILKIIHSHLILSGLTLGHPQTMQRYYTFFSFTYKKSLKSISLLFYLYKILLLILKSIQEHIYSHQNNRLISTNFISDTIFQRPFNLIEQILDKEDFEDNDENIFDRKKCLIRLIYFLDLLVQALETDTHELILSQALGINKKQKFQTKTMKFYLQLLRNHKKIGLKQFKQITDSFFVDDEVFQKFIAKSKDIVLNNGKIELKQLANQRQFSRGQRNSPQNQNNQLNKKISSQINIHYYKSFKNKLSNTGQKQYELKVPSSENHLLYLVISENFVNKVLKIISAYTDLISLNQGKIKDRETGTLSLLIIEVIKICKALKGVEVNGVDYGKISQQILKFFKGLQAKKNSINIFAQDIIKMICQLLQNEQSLSSLQKSSQQQEQKAQQRKKKLQQKKNKKLAKFKQNQQKCQQKYSSQIKNIRQQIQEQDQQQNLQNGSQAKKFCIICRQNYNQKDITNSDIALMGYMQLTDLYYYLLKGKKQETKNCNLMFKTCGHYIHMTCHNKINGNKEYSLCQLCKTTVNCLLPINVFEYNYQTFLDNPISYILKKIKQTNQHIYKELKNTYNRLYIIDVVLRENCENGYGKDLQDQREIKEKLIESLVNQMVVMYVQIEHQREQAGKQKYKFFEKKMLHIYKNLLFGLKIFIKCQQEENLPKNKAAFKKIKKNQLEQKIQDPLLIKLDEDSNIQLEKNNNQLEKQKQQKQKTENAEKDKIIYSKLLKIERFVAKWIDNFIYDVKEQEVEDFGLTKECVEGLIRLLNKLKQQELIEQQKVQEQNQMIKKPQAQSQSNKVCQQVTLLSSLIRFYSPPQKLQQLIKQRGKCPNCLRITNHIMICFICQWRGCRQCKKQSIYDHNNKNHNGNSIYLSADLGNIYYVSRKKYWVYNSLYEDYLGNHLGEYHLGVKLDKYTLNKSRLKKIYKHLMNYEIESVIRYEEYDKKRQFTQNI